MQIITFGNTVLLTLKVILPVIIRLILWWPGHLVFLFKPSPGIGEPGGYLSECHFGDDGQHDLLSLGGVGVFAVLIQPCFQSAGGFTCSVLSSGCAIKIYCPVPGNTHTYTHTHLARERVTISAKGKLYSRLLIQVSSIVTLCCLKCIQFHQIQVPL